MKLFEGITNVLGLLRKHDQESLLEIGRQLGNVRLLIELDGECRTLRASDNGLQLNRSAMGDLKVSCSSNTVGRFLLGERSLESLVSSSELEVIGTAKHMQQVSVVFQMLLLACMRCNATHHVYSQMIKPLGK